jgi:hypothetical protein
MHRRVPLCTRELINTAFAPKQPFEHIATFPPIDETLI